MFWKPAWHCARPFSSKTLQLQPTAQACSLVPPQMTGDICQSFTDSRLLTVNSKDIAPSACPADASEWQRVSKHSGANNGTFCRVMTCAMEVLRLDASSNVSIGGSYNAASLTAAAVRRRFLELSVAVHPDKNSHPQAEQVACCCP